MMMMITAGAFVAVARQTKHTWDLWILPIETQQICSRSQWWSCCWYCFVASCWNLFYFLFISSYLNICYAKCLFRIQNHRHARTHSTQPQLIHTCKIKHERLKSARTRWILRITLKAQTLVNKYVSELSGNSINIFSSDF